MKILSLAKDATLAVRFFVPEGQAAKVGVGSVIAVVVPTTAEVVAGVVDSVDFFPQELGFLQELEGPNEREKAIQVRASLTSPPAGLAAGTEVRVKLVTLKQAAPSSSSSSPSAAWPALTSLPTSSTAAPDPSSKTRRRPRRSR